MQYFNCLLDRANKFVLKNTGNGLLEGHVAKTCPQLQLFKSGWPADPTDDFSGKLCIHNYTCHTAFVNE